MNGEKTSAGWEVGVATTEAQKALVEAALNSKTWQKRYGRSRYTREPIYGMNQPLRWKVRRERRYDADVWVFYAQTLGEWQAAEGLIHHVLLNRFKAGDRFALTIRMADGHKRGDTGTVVANYSGNLYVHMDDEPEPDLRKGPAGEPYYHVKFIGAWWAEPID